MNRRAFPWLLVIALNGAIWFAFTRKARTKDEPAAPSVARVEARRSAAAAPVVIRTNAFEWKQLESEDYRAYVARLRNIGCPEETIRDIIIADLQELMAPRLHAVEGPREPPRYWKPQPKAFDTVLGSLEKLRQKQEIDFEQREIIRELLGVDLAAERARLRGETDLYEERLNFLSPEKISRVRMITERANQEEIWLREKSWIENDELTAEEQKRLAEFQEQKEREIAAVLSPEEFERYNYWFSPSACRVREGFLLMEPTEEDFLALYRIQREFDAAWEGVDPSRLSGAEREKFERARREFEERLRAHLGPERFAKFQASRDPDFQQLHTASAAFGLDPNRAAEVYSFKQLLIEERARVRENPQYTAGQKERICQALAEEVERSIVEALGPKAFRYYLRSGAGKWIRE